MSFKKILLTTASILVAASATAQATQSYKGFAIGLNAGWMSSNYKNSLLNKSFNTMPVGAHVDFHQSTPNSLYWGLGLGLGYHFGNPGSNVSTTFLGAPVNVNVKQKRKFFGELTPRLGYSFGNAVLYGLVGLRLSSIEANVTTTTPAGAAVPAATGKDSWTSFGIAPGLGFDVKVAQHWSIGAEYKYYFERSKQISVNSTNVGDSTKNRSHNLTVRASYHF